MQLVRCQPQRNLARRTNSTSRVFDTFFDDFFTPFISPAVSHSKAQNVDIKVDIYEKENEVVIDAELPGIAKEDLFVDAKGKIVTLGGERKIDEEVNDQNSYRRERRYGKLERSFNLPFEVNVENVKAAFTNGILTLTIPKPEKEEAKKIEIQ